jgi:hypothetical protein
MATHRKLSDYTPDDRNANKGSPRGYGALEHSLRQYGAGRSLLVDKNGKLIAGNKTAEKAAELGIEDVIEVQTDGRQLVVVRRTDLDLDTDAAARELSIADNRVGELSLTWDASMLADLAQETDLSQLFTGEELATYLSQAADEQLDVEFKEYDESVENEVKYCTCPKCGHRWPV